jgi:hypothetical protein
MSFPVFVDEVALASDPFDSVQVWTDLSVRTRLRSWSRGRQTEGVRPDTGRSSTTFENTDRALDTENAASVYYPNVLPMRRIRSRASLDGVTWYDLFTTFVDPLQGWQIVQDSPGYAEVVATANDGFDVLSTAQFTELDSFPQETVGARINAILDLFNWPAGTSVGWTLGDAVHGLLGTSTWLDFLPLGRSIDAGPTVIQAAPAGTLTGQSALDQIQAAADTEDGVFFFDGRGTPVFHDRYHDLLNTRSVTSQATFCDAANLSGGAFLYTSLTPSSSPVVNDYLVTRAGGVQTEALDTASIGRYRRRSTTLSTLHLTDLEALDYGRYKVIHTRDPHRRYDDMTITPGADSAVWLILFQLGIGDRITVMWSPPGGGAADTRNMFIEAVSFDVGPGVEATVKYRLSPGSQSMGWALGDAVHSLLGQTTTVVY